MPLLTLDHVSKSFGSSPVFTDVTASFERGRAYAIVGPNGVGKFVLFKLMLGFLRPDSGTVRIDPAISPQSRLFPDRFGIVMDPPGYLAHKTGRENLAQLAEIQGRASADDITAALDRFGILNVADNKVKTYSLGMKQKLALAQATFEDQQVLLLDEPFSALDASSLVNVHGILRVLVADGKTIIFTSHNPADIEAVADEVLQIDNGTLVPHSA